MKPWERRYRHDCTQCVFLGQFGTNDLYFCPQGHDPTVLARYGDEGAAYTSGLTLVEHFEELLEARRRARAMGFLPCFTNYEQNQAEAAYERSLGECFRGGEAAAYEREQMQAARRLK